MRLNTIQNKPVSNQRL